MSTAIQSAPAGPATGSSGRTSGARPRSSPTSMDRASGSVAEPAHHLDLDGAVRQRDREPTRDVRVGRTTEDEVRPGVLVEPRIDLVAVSERREVSAVGRHEPDAGGRRFAARRVDDLDVDPSRRRAQRLDDDPAEPPLARRQPEGRSPGSGPRRSRPSRPAPSRGRRADAADDAASSVGTPQPTTRVGGRPAATGAGAGALPEHLPEIHRRTRRNRRARCRRSAASGGARRRAARRFPGTS